ncbi:hypothetical protein [Roseisolibacter sp. H3M3-2]|uniref:hypothetical protein n=1 Tax=Roseisolibacter sp. H3M3-2 TaxID=3031323 RepID=UPI0023DC6024|nr:hypothetical protein [Roseisolibacter sp. H3M3-2]MDF1503361.1 hypothetical protein [Roseisolibacter sp. H3M3-2]
MTRRLLAAAALALAAAAAGAQVGFPPERSPFVDLEFRQATTVFGGWYGAAKDPAGIAPQSGPLVGARYDIYLGGPASFTARAATAISERNVLDPARREGNRLLGVERRPLTMADVGITLGLTGQKSWRGMVPTVHSGIGVVSNLASADPGGYRFGTRFHIAYGAGLRFVPRSSPWAVRADVGSYLFQIRYPDSYSTPGLDSTSILPSGSSKSKWTNNLGLTLGLSYQFSR